jgi:hypothetical protein
MTPPPARMEPSCRAKQFLGARASVQLIPGVWQRRGSRIVRAANSPQLMGVC